MKELNSILKQYLSEQVALEEFLYKSIEEQITELDSSEFIKVKELLIEISQILEEQFNSSNELLDLLEENIEIKPQKEIYTNGEDIKSFKFLEAKYNRISKMLQNNYSTLNQININNTLLHTTALTLNSDKIANTALKNLEKLAPLIVKIRELVPDVIAKELLQLSSKIDQKISQIALSNIRRAWQNS